MDDAAHASREGYRIGYESALIDVRRLADMPDALARIADMEASRPLTPEEWEKIRASWESHLKAGSRIHPSEAIRTDVGGFRMLGLHRRIGPRRQKA